MSGGDNGGDNGGSETGGNYAKGGQILGPGAGRRDDSVLAVLSHGGGFATAYAPTPADVERLIKPEWTADQAARALAWIKAHYGKPEFRCPEQSSDEP